MQRESLVGTVPLPRHADIEDMYGDELQSESSHSSSDSGIDGTGSPCLNRYEKDMVTLQQYRELLRERRNDDDRDEEEEEKAYVRDMNDLNNYYAKLVADGQFDDVGADEDFLPSYLRPKRTSSQEEEEEVANAILNDPEVLHNTIRNTHPESSPRGVGSAAARKAAKNHVHFLNGSPVPSSRKSLVVASEALPAWDLPVSPMDKTFRSRIGGPLGTAPDRPVYLQHSDEDNSDEDNRSSTGSSDSGDDVIVHRHSSMDDEHYGGSSEDTSGDAPHNAIDSSDSEEENSDLHRFLQLERAIFTVISPYMTASPSGKRGPGPVVFSRDLLRSISRAAVGFILPNASASLNERSTEGVYSVLRMFEGAEVTDSYRLLMDLLKSVLEELITTEDNLETNRNPPVVGYDKVGIPKSMAAKVAKLESKAAPIAPSQQNGIASDNSIPSEWTHPLIADLLKQNPSLRAYVKSRSDAEARAAGFEKPGDSKNAPVVAGRMYVLSSSSSSVSTESGSSSPSETVDVASDEETDPMTKLMNTSMASTDMNTASPKRSPRSRQTETLPFADATVSVGLTSTDPPPRRQLADCESPKSSPPRNSPKRIIHDAAHTTTVGLSTGDYSDEEVLNEFQERVSRSPLINKMSATTDAMHNAVDITRHSPKLRAEARRRRRHSNVPHDDSSSAGNGTEEEIRKELHKSAPYDDSSSASEDVDSEAERFRRQRHGNLSYDDSTSAGNRSEEEIRKQKHMNVPYDDSSSASEATDEEARRAKHKNVPYDDSSTADVGPDGSDDSVDSKDLLAKTALATAVNDWDQVNEEEMIRRKFRAEGLVQGSESKKLGDDGNRKFVSEDDDDYDFAAAVVKYWDQLLGPDEAEATEEDEIEEALRSRRAAMVAMQSFNTTAAVARSETPSTDDSNERDTAVEAGEASFEEFKNMSPEQRTQYLYGAIDHPMGTEAMNRDLNMVQSDLHLWQEMDKVDAQAPENLNGKTTTQRDYATLRNEIFQLAAMLGVSPSDVLLKGGSLGAKATPKPTFTSPSDNYKKTGHVIPRPSDEDYGDDALAGFLNGLNLSDLRISSSKRPAKKGKKKPKASASKSNTTRKGNSTTAASKPMSKSTSKKTCPPSPSLLRPTTSFTKSKASGQTKKKAKAASSAAVNKAATDRGKRRIKGKDKNASFAVAEELMGPVPVGSVNFVSIKRRTVDSVGAKPVLVSQKAMPSSPALFLQSPHPRTGVLNARPSSAPHKRMTRKVSYDEKLNDTDIVVVNNSPVYPQSNYMRPSSAPPSKRRPKRAESPVLRTSRRSSADRIGQSLTTQSLARSRSSRLSSSLNAPTMASIHRTNEVLTRALDFMSVPRPKHPWDSYRVPKTSRSATSTSPRKRK